MVRRLHAILHIGTETTGSTSIQAMLARNRVPLQKQGFAYLRSPGEVNHTHLAIFAAKESATRELSATIPGGRGHVVATLRDDMRHEVAELPANVHTVLLSNEHCHSRLHSADE